MTLRKALVNVAGTLSELPNGETIAFADIETHNHSGVYEPADATILKDADIGVTVQAYVGSFSPFLLMGA